MAQERKVNIMSVELAIKRELAYREKLARLYPDADCIQHFLPLEVPSSAKTSSPNLGSSHSLGQSSVATVDHHIPISNPPCQKPSSAAILSPNSNSTDLLGPSSISGVGHQCLFPNASCQKLSSTPRPGPGSGPLSDLTMVASHQPPSPMAGLEPLPVESQDLNHSSWPNPNVAPTDSVIKEKGTASSFQYLPYQQPQPFHIGNGTNFTCKVCNVSCSNSFNYKQHIRGHKHKAKLQMQQLSRNGAGMNKLQQPRCNLCQIWCTDENCLKLHLDGQKHKAKLKEIELCQKGIAPQQLWCELCQVPCTNEDSFRMHLKGKNHLAHLYAMGEKNRVI